MHKDRKESDYWIPAINLRYAAAKFAAYSFFSTGMLFLFMLILDAVDGLGSDSEIFGNIIMVLMLICIVAVLITGITSIIMALTVTAKRNKIKSRDKLLGQIFRSGRTFSLPLLKGWKRFGINLLKRFVIAIIIPLIMIVFTLIVFRDAEIFGGFVVLVMAGLFGWGLIDSLAILQREREETLYRCGVGESFWKLRKADTTVFEMLESENAEVISLNLWERGVGDYAANVCKEVVTDATDATDSVYCFTGEDINRYLNREVTATESAADMHLIAVPVISCTGGQRKYLISRKAANCLKRSLRNLGGVDYGWFTHFE